MNFIKPIKWSPKKYINAAFIAKEAEIEMLNRLQWMTIQPSVVVDMGCGAGEAIPALSLQYPKATIIALDNCFDMIAYAHQYRKKMASPLCADASILPFKDHSIDLIFANLLLPWCHGAFQSLFKEWRRVLKEEGVLMFSALGPDTLQEIKNLDSSNISNISDCLHFMDMHDIGDALLSERFSDPVLDVSFITSEYQNQSQLAQDLIDSGMLLSDAVANLKIYPSPEKKLELTYEIIFAHAFAPAIDLTFRNESGEVSVPLTQFKKMLTR